MPIFLRLKFALIGVVHDAPRSWTQDDVFQFLHDQKWLQIQVVTRKRMSKKSLPVWIVKAQAPCLLPAGVSDSFSYSDESSCITVTPEVRAKKKTLSWETVTLKGPKKKWTDKGASGPQEIPATVLDLLGDTDDEDDHHESLRNARPKGRTAPDEARERSRSRGPKETSARHATYAGAPVAEVDPDDLLRQSFGLIPQYCGGAGDCAFRSLAYLLALQQSKQFKEDDLSREAASLRVKCALHLPSHQKELSEFWCTDDDDDLLLGQGPGSCDYWGVRHLPRLLSST